VNQINANNGARKRRVPAWLKVIMALGILATASFAFYPHLRSMLPETLAVQQMLQDMATDYVEALRHWRPHYPELLVLMPFLVWAALQWGKRQFTIRHSSLAPHRKSLGLFGRRSKLTALTIIGYSALILSCLHLDIAMTVPTVPQAVISHIVKVLRACIQGDKSGSMDTELNKGIPEKADSAVKEEEDGAKVKVDNGGPDKFIVHEKPAEKKSKTSRAYWMKVATDFFVHNLMTLDPYNTDHVCLQRFDMDVYMVWPLSNDRYAVEIQAQHMDDDVGSGTNFAGPTAFVPEVGPLQFIYDYYDKDEESPPDSTNVDVLITDGYDALDAERRAELVKLFLKRKIKLYVIGLGDGWNDPDKPMDLDKFVTELNAADPDHNSGQVFRAQEPGQMQAAMETIKQLQKHLEVVKEEQTYRDVDYVFIILAAGFFGIFIVSASAAGRNL
jgi:hypothetical protein